MISLNELSNKLFEYTLVNHSDINTLAKTIGIPSNDLARIQSENKFVDSSSIEKVAQFFNNIDNKEYYER